MFVLAQVEDLLKETAKGGGDGNADELPAGQVDFGFPDFSVNPEEVMAAQFDEFEDLSVPLKPPKLSAPSAVPFLAPEFAPDQAEADAKNPTALNSELIGLGLYEALPPFEVMEDLYACSYDYFILKIRLIFAATRFSSNVNIISFPFFILVAISKHFTQRRISGRQWRYSTLSGPWLPMVMRSTAPTTTSSIKGHVSTPTPTSYGYPTPNVCFPRVMLIPFLGLWRTLHHSRTCPSLGSNSNG
jgi:hypothetical protein